MKLIDSLWPPCRYCGHRRLMGFGWPDTRTPDHVTCMLAHGWSSPPRRKEQGAVGIWQIPPKK